MHLKGTYERIEFASDDPGNRTPGSSEEEDIDTHECNQGLLRSCVGGGSRNTDNGDNVFADAHTGSSDEEELTASEVINCPHARESRDDIDNVGHDRDDERVRDTSLSEECGSVVEDELKN